MAQLLFLFGRTRIKAAHIYDELREFEATAHLPSDGYYECDDFVFWGFDYSSTPRKFQADFRPELSGDLFQDYGVGRVLGNPFVRRDLVPTKRTWLDQEQERGYEDLIFEHPEWTEYLKRLATNYATQPPPESTRAATLLFVESRDVVSCCPTVRELRRRLGQSTRYHWQTERSFVASLWTRASPQTACRGVADLLSSDNVIEFAAFQISTEYVSGLGTLNSMEHWLLPPSKRPLPQVENVRSGHSIKVERVHRPSRHRSLPRKGPALET